MGSLFGGLKENGNRIGTAIGEGYAKQGKSWDEIASMPSSGGGLMSDAIRSGVKTGYDNYMTNNKPAPVSTSSANMIQSPGGSDGGLAASTVFTGSQVGTNMFNQAQLQDGASTNQGMPNGLAASVFNEHGRFGANQTVQAPGQYNIIDGVQLI